MSSTSSCRCTMRPTTCKTSRWCLATRCRNALLFPLIICCTNSASFITAQSDSESYSNVAVFIKLFFGQAAGLFAVVAVQVPVPATFCSGLPLVAATNRPSPSPALASCRSNPCLFVPPQLSYFLFCYSLL